MNQRKYVGKWVCDRIQRKDRKCRKVLQAGRAQHTFKLWLWLLLLGTFWPVGMMRPSCRALERQPRMETCLLSLCARRTGCSL